MTVIAYKDGIMAADGATWQGEVKVAFTARKIQRTADGALWACTGALDDKRAFSDWVDAGAALPAPKPRDEDFTAILVRNTGQAVRFMNGLPYDVPSDFMSAGAHDDFLNGVMLHGGSAEEAVRLAIKYCTWAGGEIQVERLENAE